MSPLCGRILIKVQMTPIIFPPPRHHSVRRNIDSSGRGQIIKLNFFPPQGDSVAKVKAARGRHVRCVSANFLSRL